MRQPFQMSLLELNGQKQIDFANNSSDFVEVVFTVNGREVRLGENFSSNVRGFCYPPFHHKPIRTMSNGGELPLEGSGTIKAIVYSGIGKTQEDDLDVPPFIRYKLNEKRFQSHNRDNILRQGLKKRAAFRRSSSNPIAILEIPF